MTESSPTPPTSSEPEPGAAPASPYKNLFVPLVVVPAVIVGAIVLVFLFFGAIAGHEATLEENLDRVVAGGAGDHQQAAFNLVRQIAENQAARAEGRDLPWPVDASFLPRLDKAWETTPPDESLIRLVLASLSGQLGDPGATAKLISLLGSPLVEDKDGVQFHALANLGGLADPEAAAPIARFLEQSPDDGLRSVAAVALQRIPGDVATEALRGALDDPAFEVRANAAIALSTRGDAAGAEMLVSLLDPATYAEQHAHDAKKYAVARRISESRVQAVAALARLGRPEDRERLSALADAEKDLAVREAAMKALQPSRAAREGD